jgi:hypothetical protein
MPRRQHRCHRKPWHRHRGALLLAGAGIAVLLAVLFARPLYRQWRAAEVRSTLAQAREALELHDYETTLRLTQEALTRQPNDPAALETLADALIGLEGHPDEIVAVLKAARDAGNTKPELELKLAKTHLRRGDLIEAQFALSRVPEASRDTWEAVEVESELLQAQGRQPAAAEKQRQALETTPEAPGAAFRLAALDLADPLFVRQKAGRERIWLEARQNGPQALLAVRLLASDARLTIPEAHELLTLSENLAPRGSELRFSAMQAVLRVDKDKSVSFIAAQARAATDWGLEDQVRFLQFLARQQQSQVLLEYLDAYRSRFTSRRHAGEVTGLELEALGQQRQWTDVRKLLDSPRGRLVDTISANLWRACALAAEDSADAQIPLCLLEAFEATQRGRRAMPAMRIADTAARLNQPAFAVDCYETLITAAQLPAERITLLEKACAALAQTSDTAAQLRLARQLSDLTPGHEDNAYRAHYLALLTPEASIEAITLRLQAENDLTPAQTARRRLLWAMLAHRRGQPALIAKELQGIETTTTWTAGERAVLSGLLATASETARAFALAEKVPASLLLPEEAALLKLAK